MERFSSLLLLFALFAVVIGAKWNYDENSEYGPKNWNKQFAEFCNATQFPRQSPIDIKKGWLIYDKNLGDMRFDNYKATDVKFQAKNNGHTVQFDLLKGDVKADGGPVPDDTHYYVIQLHFHWGNSTNPNYGDGSEHTILGQRHKAEMHIVHVNHKHNKLEVAEIVKKDDGLLVLGVFIDVADESKGQKPNAEFSKIINASRMVKDQANTTYKMAEGELNLMNLLPTDKKYYYTYPGSLTTPDCHETVTWVLFKDVIYVKKEELEVFYTVKDADGEPLMNIFRPPQPVGTDRKVRTTNPEDGYTVVSGGTSVKASFVFFLSALLLVVFA